MGSVREYPVVDPLGPALLDPDLRILLSGNTRKLDPEEWVKIKGLPKAWRPGPKAIRSVVENMAAHEWSALGDFVSHLEASRGESPAVTSLPPETAPSIPPAVPSPETNPSDPPVKGWSWQPPDLGPESAFYTRQISRLWVVTEELGGPPNGSLMVKPRSPVTKRTTAPVVPSTW
jgi:hypothetical protein